jgi:integrase
MQALTPELKSLLLQVSQQLNSEPAKNPPLLEVWDNWVNELCLTPQTKAGHYNHLRRQIIKVGNPSSADTAWFSGIALSPTTTNRWLWLLKEMSAWAVSENLLSANPWLRVKPRKTAKQVVKPFSREEAAKIIAGFEKTYPAWSSFAKFLFLSGCRMSEAIGLQWKDIDFQRKEICICESLALVIGGNGHERVRKDTKTGSVRVLMTNTQLTELLEQIKPASAKPDELVFKNPTRTNHVDSHNFRSRWIKVLERAGIPYRRPHVIRHSFASHAIDQGIPLTGVAYLLGHSDTRMICQVYGHMINRPSLPQILGGSNE